jgi:hypothetical protein
MPLPSSFEIVSPEQVYPNERLLGTSDTPRLQDEGITSLKDFFSITSEYVKGTTWWFRGESEPYAIPCLNGFARDYIAPNGHSPKIDPTSLDLLVDLQKDRDGKDILVSCFTKQEEEIIVSFKKNHPMDAFFVALVSGEHSPGWISYAQHYGIPTRLLDVTSNALVALFFACGAANNANVDGSVWLFPSPPDQHKVHPPVDYREIFDAGIMESQAIAFYEAGRMSEYSGRGDNALIDTVFSLKLDDPNKRVLAQSGAFLWSPNPLLPLNRGALRIKVKGAAKLDILSELQAYSITKDILFPS